MRHSVCVCVFGCATWVLAVAADPQPISPSQFRERLAQVKLQPGESRFLEIPWLLSMDEALKKAAEEGKPILVWSGAGGPPHSGSC
ncbi:MAG: hypothetical protein C4297_14620 [Gemmataceae bacterium]